MKTITFTFIALLVSVFSFATPPTGHITTIVPVINLSANNTFAGGIYKVYFTTDVAPIQIFNPSAPGNCSFIYYQVELSDANGNFGSNPSIITGNTTVMTTGSNQVTNIPTVIQGMPPQADNQPSANITSAWGVYNSAGTFYVNVTFPALGIGNYKVRVVPKYLYHKTTLMMYSVSGIPSTFANSIAINSSGTFNVPMMIVNKDRSSKPVIQQY